MLIARVRPCLRVLPSSTFLVYSDDLINPEEETIFMKFVSGSDDNLLIFAYSKDEFDAFYLNGADANEYLIENGGVNLYGVIPFVYGKRQKNVLLPILDSDMLAITKAIPAMLTDASGAQLYQSFSIIWGIDVKIDNPKLSPNAFWNMKSDKESDKNPQIGVIKPEADTEKIMQFIQSVFILWLETKGIKVGSVGSMDGNNSASGIAKIIDEMDAYNVVKKSAMWFEYDEQEFWNEKLPKIHNYWIKSGQINPAKFPSLMPDIDYDVTITFEKPEPMISKKELLENTKQELEMKTMTLKQAIEALHPKYTEEEINEVLDAKEVSDQNNNQSTRKPQTSGSDQVSGISN
jgi:hypothetical protein